MKDWVICFFISCSILFSDDGGWMRGETAVSAIELVLLLQLSEGEGARTMSRWDMERESRPFLSSEGGDVMARGRSESVEGVWLAPEWRGEATLACNKGGGVWLRSKLFWLWNAPSMTVIFRLLLRWPVGVEVPETAPREGLRLFVERDEEVSVSLIISSIIKLCNWRWCRF